MKSAALAFTAAALLFSAPAIAADAPMSKGEVEALVKQVIQDNPELIINSVEAYQVKQQALAMSKTTTNIVKFDKELKQDPASPSSGNPKGDVTLIEFFDYHCGYCKHFFPALVKLSDEDKHLRVVYKEFPVLSEDSALAARAALAVNSIDPKKYFAFHAALMKANVRAFTQDFLDAAAKEVGIDADALKKAMDKPEVQKELDKTKELGQSLNVQGTPTIIVGHEFIPGAIDYDALKAKVAEARQQQDAGKK